MSATEIVARLATSSKPGIAYLARVAVGAADPRAPDVVRLRDSTRACERVRRLLGERDSDGRIPFHPYA